jgi:hypothetical protein
MITADAIAIVVVLVSLIAVFIMVRREHKRNRPRQDAEEC